jgi:hypothetical protein
LPDPALQRTICDGFGADAAGEDRFDCILGLLCVLNVLAGNRPDTAPNDPWIRRWEGWVLGQTANAIRPGHSGRGAGPAERKIGAPDWTRPSLLSVTHVPLHDSADFDKTQES